MSKGLLYCRNKYKGLQQRIGNGDKEINKEQEMKLVIRQ